MATFIFLLCSPPKIWFLDLHLGSSPVPRGHRGESGRSRHIILTLLNPRLFSLLLVAVRGSWEIYWSAANLWKASSKPHDPGSDFTKISQSNRSEAPPSTSYSHKLWFLVGGGTVKGLAGADAFLAFPTPTGSTLEKGEHLAPVMSLHWLRGTHTEHRTFHRLCRVLPAAFYNFGSNVAATRPLPACGGKTSEVTHTDPGAEREFISHCQSH